MQFRLYRIECARPSPAERRHGQMGPVAGVSTCANRAPLVSWWPSSGHTQLGRANN